MAKPRTGTDHETGLQPAPRPGEQLRSARESQGMTVQDVAARLRLDAKIIATLEDSAYERLPAAAYARGYLRSYARLINIDPAPLLAAYDRHAGAPPDLTPYASSPEPQARASDVPVKAVTYLVVITLLVLLGLWLWQTQKFSALTALTIPKWGAEPAAGPGGTAVATPAAGVAVTEPAALPQHPQAPALSYSYEVVEHPDNPAIAVAVTAPTPAPAPSPGAAPALPVTAPAPASPEAGAPSAAQGARVLSFQLAGDSWIEVFDATSRKLYYNLGRRDSRVSVQGELPYRVRIGNAPAVAVTYEGRPLNISSYAVAGVARFSIAADGSLTQ